MIAQLNAVSIPSLLLHSNIAYLFYTRATHTQTLRSVFNTDQLDVCGFRNHK